MCPPTGPLGWTHMRIQTLTCSVACHPCQAWPVVPPSPPASLSLSPPPRLGLWKHLADYFPTRLVKTCDLDPDQNYVFVFHPHGIATLSSWWVPGWMFVLVLMCICLCGSQLAWAHSEPGGFARNRAGHTSSMCARSMCARSLVMLPSLPSTPVYPSTRSSQLMSECPSPPPHTHPAPPRPWSPAHAPPRPAHASPCPAPASAPPSRPPWPPLHLVMHAITALSHACHHFT